MQTVTGHLQAYDWGPTDGLARWTDPTGGPQAELWFGTHQNGPSPLRDGGGVGAGAMPILMKLLAAARPLSIQIHPPAQLAAAMYAQSDPLVSDPYGKAEILIALADFAILEGLRDPGESAKVFERLGLDEMAHALSAGDLPAAIRAALSLPSEVVGQKAPVLPDAFDDEDTAQIMAEVVACYPADPGVFVAALMNARTLAAGQAVYVHPGTVHAYVRGIGLEVMTSSDNVLRLGLTSKTIAVDPALEALDVHARPLACPPHVVQGIATYAPQGAPFVVQFLQDTTAVAPGGHARIVLCVEGHATVAGVGLRAGEAVLLGADEPQATITVDGSAAIARDANVAPGTQG